MNTPIRKDHPAVYLNFVTYGFDVVPAFHRTGGGYYIPSHIGSGWMATDPTKHADRTTAMNNVEVGISFPSILDKMIAPTPVECQGNRLTREGFILVSQRRLSLSFGKATEKN
jgi:hypothetical protein